MCPFHGVLWSVWNIAVARDVKEMSLFQGGIDEVKVIGICVNVNRFCGSFMELYGALQLPRM